MRYTIKMFIKGGEVLVRITAGGVLVAWFIGSSVGKVVSLIRRFKG